jgi:hypothetical protein
VAVLALAQAALTPVFSENNRTGTSRADIYGE